MGLDEEDGVSLERQEVGVVNDVLSLGVSDPLPNWLVGDLGDLGPLVSLDFSSGTGIEGSGSL